MIKKIAFAYLMIPVIFFLLLFVRRRFAIPACTVLIFSYLLSTKNKSKKDEGVYVSVIDIIIVVFICILWCFLGGQGGFFYQTSDWNERNAIFRDLIRCNYPIYYEVTDTILTYYIGHWLPAAFVGRLFLKFTGNLEIAWIAGNIFLWMWTALGCFLTYFLFTLFVKPHKKWALYVLLLVLIFFSGLDIVGCVYKGWRFEDIMLWLHLEWWLDYLQFSSNTTCLFWVYNQAIPAWVATLCFLNEKKCQNYVFIFTCAFMSSTLPCIGLFVLMVVNAIAKMIFSAKSRKLKPFLETTFSFQNIGVSLFVLPILAAYYMTNSVVENLADNDVAKLQNTGMVYFFLGSCVLIILFMVIVNVMKKEKCRFNYALMGISCICLSFAASYKINPDFNIEYLMFLLLEVGFYLVLVFRMNYNNPLFYAICCIFILAPAVKIGIGADFCMRASIPAMVTLMCFVGQRLTFSPEKPGEKKFINHNRILTTILVITLCIGAVTPSVEIYRGFKKVYDNQKMNLVADEIYTLDQYHSSGGIYGNFVSDRYEDSIFYKYLIQRNNLELEAKRAK